jgi:hypothetical protein
MTLRQIVKLVLLSAIWGSMFLLVKYALTAFSPTEVAFFQATIGAIGLFVIVNVQGGAARAKLGDIVHRPGPALLLGVLAIAAPFMLITLGELVLALAAEVTKLKARQGQPPKAPGNSSVPPSVGSRRIGLSVGHGSGGAGIFWLRRLLRGQLGRPAAPA